MRSLPRKEALDGEEQGTFLLIKMFRILDSCKACTYFIQESAFAATENNNDGVYVRAQSSQSISQTRIQLQFHLLNLIRASSPRCFHLSSNCSTKALQSLKAMPRCFVKPTDYWQLVSATHLRSCKTQEVFEQGRKKWAGDKFKKRDPKTRMDQHLIKNIVDGEKGSDRSHHNSFEHQML